MSYAVTLQSHPLRKIIGWDVSGSVMRAILDGFDQVARNPNQYLIRVGPPEDRLQFDLEIHDVGPPLRRYLFVFSVLYHADEETLLIVDADHIYHELPGPPPATG